MVDFFLSLTVAMLPFSTALVEIGVFGSLLSWGLEKILTKKAIHLPPVLKTCYFIFILVMMFSLSQVPPDALGTAVRGVFKWVKYLLFFILCQEKFTNPETVKRNVSIFLVSMLAATLNGFYQVLHGTDALKGYSIDIPGRLVRMKSSLKSPNDLAAFYLFAIPVSFGQWLKSGGWTRKSAFYLTLCALFFVAFCLTFSRAAFLCLALAAMLFFLLNGRKTLIAAALLLIALPALSPMIRHNILSGFSQQDKTVRERAQYWSAAWKMIKDKPFTGHGINTYTRQLGRYVPADEKYRGYAHNCYLQLWSEIGIFGLLAFLVPFVWALWPPPIEPVLWTGLAAYLGHSFFDTNFYSLQVATLFWLFFGLYVAHVKKITSVSLADRGY